METALIIVSDNGCTCNGNKDTGSVMLTYLIDSGYNVLCKIVPDEQAIVEEVLKEYSDNPVVGLVLICSTDKNLPYLEKFNGFNGNYIEECKFNYGLCGIKSSTTVIYLPGSSDEVLDCYKKIEYVVLDAVSHLRENVHSNGQMDYSLIKKGNEFKKKVDPSTRAMLIRKGNEFFTGGNIKSAENIFVSVDYKDGLVRLGDYYYDHKDLYNAARMYFMSENSAKIESFCELAAKAVQRMMCVDQKADDDGEVYDKIIIKNN